MLLDSKTMGCKQERDQMRLQKELSCFFLTMGFIFFWMTILIASSKILLRPSWVSALHSMYLHWNSYSMIFLAVSRMMGASLGSFLYNAYSSRRSVLFPTKIFGTFPTFSCSSGYHYVKVSLPFCVRWQTRRAQQLKRLWGRHRSWGKRGASIDYTLPGLPYPRVPVWPFVRRLWRSLNSCRRQWGRIR